MDRLTLIFDCARQAWRMESGDPLPLGVALTAGYVLATLAMLAVVYARPAVLTLPRERLLWGAATLAIWLLAINKQLDVQLFTAQLGRCLSQSEGLDPTHFDLNRGFAFLFLALAAACLIALLYTCRGALRANLPLLLGLGLAAFFLIFRVSKLEHLEWLRELGVKSNKLHRSIEAAALVVLLFAALRKRFVR